MRHISFEVKVLRTLEEVEAMRSVWFGMQWTPESDIDFYLFIIKIRPEVIRPYVLVVYKEGKPISLVAGRLEDSHLDIKVGYKVLLRPKVRRLVIFWGGFMGDTGNNVTAIVVRRLLRSLREEGADLLLWNGVQWNTDLRQQLRRIPCVPCRDCLTRAVRHWQMSLPSSLEELFERRMNKKHRYWARRTTRMLEKDFPGGVRYASFSSLNDVERFFAEVLRIAQKTYQWGLGVGFQGGVENRERLALEARNGWFRGYVLYVKDKPVTFWICTVYKETVYLDYTGYDPDFGKYEVGTALLFRVVDEMCRENIKQLDFGPGSAFYKERLADSSFEEGAMYAFAFSLRGVLLNVLRLLTQLPIELMRQLLLHLGLEQRAKRWWRSHAVLNCEPDRLVKTSAQAESSRTC